MAIYKNVASQKIAVFAWDTANDTEKTGDAANITAQISKDGAATAATNDTNPTELDPTDAPGIYIFDMTQAETNADLIILSAVSGTADIKIEPVIIYTLPTWQASQVAQTGDSYTRLGAPAGASVSADIAAIEAQTDDIGAAGAGLTAIPWNPDWDAEVQSEVADALAVYDPPTNAELASEIDAVQADIAALNNLSAAQVNAEVDTALADINLDHLVKSAVDTDFATTVHLNSVVGHLADNGTSATFDRTTDSLEALQGAIDTVDNLIDTEIATLQTTANNIETDTQDIQSKIGTPAGASLSADIAAIEAQTDDIGAAGAGLTAIPWNSAWDTEVQSEVQDALEANNLDHLVGTATGIPAVVSGTYLDQIMDDGTATYDRTTDSLQALADSGGGGPTVQQIVDGVLDEAIADHLDAGSVGEAINAAGGAGDPWITALPGSYTSGQAGYIVGTNLNTTVSSRASQASVDTVDDFLDTEVAAIKAKTDNLPSDPADASDIASSFSTVNTTLATIAGYIDTEVGAIKAKTDNLPTDPADQSAVEAAITAAVSPLALQASVDDLEGRLTAARAGYLDNLSAGAVALQSSVDDLEGRLTAQRATNLDNLDAAISTRATPAQVNTEVVDVVGTDIIPDSVAADGSRPTINQALLMISRFLMEKSVSSTTVTVKKEDGSTNSMTFTLDNDTTPTSITRSG